MKNINKALILILILSFIIRMAFAFASPVKWWDEAVYANLGYDLSKNLSDYSFANNGWSDFIPDDSWPHAGFRAPLLPYFFSIFYFFKLDYLITFLMPFIGTLSVFLTYILGKKLFNEEAGIYSAILLAFLPLHVFYSGKMLTDVFATFFIVLAFISFWKGYEEHNNKHKILFGFFLALSILARYSSLWVMPIFPLYILIRDRSLAFLRERYNWYSVLAFFLPIIPWLIYSLYEYGGMFGAFIHGFKAASYWGGVQPWYFFFQGSLSSFSIIGSVFILSLIYIIYKKDYEKKNVFLILMWIFIFLLIAMTMPHKEDRFLLAVSPAMCLVTSYFIINMKKFNNIILVLIMVVLLFSLASNLNKEYDNSLSERDICFLKMASFLLQLPENSVVITDNSPVIYYFSKKETHFYPNPWSLYSFEKLADNYHNKGIYLELISFWNTEKESMISEDVKQEAAPVFYCFNRTAVYKYIGY